MPSSHVALIRGINLGRARRVAMADLRTLVTELGYRDVRTLLNSGNVVLTAPASVRGDHGGRIEKAMAARVGIHTRVIMLTAAELGRVVADNTLERVATDPSRLQVVVPATAADLRRVHGLVDGDWGPEAVAAGRRALYVWTPGGLMESAAMKEVNRNLGDAVTVRNWSTISKLHALAGGT